MQFPIGGPLKASLSITVSEIFNVECDAMVDMTLIPLPLLNEGQGTILVPTDFLYATSYKVK